MKMTILAACEACAKMGATNCCDVKITESIMSGIAWIVAICVGGYIVVKLIDVCFKACQEKRKKEWEEKEAERKRDRELLEKKLDKLKDAKDMDVVTCIKKIDEIISSKK